MKLKRGDTAVVVADLPSFEGDEHGVPLQTVVTVLSTVELDTRELVFCEFYNCGDYERAFYADELAVVE